MGRDPPEAANLDFKLNSQNKLKDLIGKTGEQKEISNGKLGGAPIIITMHSSQV
jgi:hypothetical protein